VLDCRFVMKVRFVGGLEERRVEDLFLDGRVHLECIANLRCQLLLAVRIARLLELAEPVLDLAVVRLQQGDRILGAG
jgi:hypothetical protein